MWIVAKSDAQLLLWREIVLNLVFSFFVSTLGINMSRHSNVVILTTSNVTEKIDLAFVDRADIKQYIGPPSEKGIYNIYLSCLEELMKVTSSFANDNFYLSHMYLCIKCSLVDHVMFTWMQWWAPVR